MVLPRGRCEHEAQLSPTPLPPFRRNHHRQSSSSNRRWDRTDWLTRPPNIQTVAYVLRRGPALGRLLSAFRQTKGLMRACPIDNVLTRIMYSRAMRGAPDRMLSIVCKSLSSPVVHCGGDTYAHAKFLHDRHEACKTHQGALYGLGSRSRNASGPHCNGAFRVPGDRIKSYMTGRLIRRDNKAKSREGHVAGFEYI